MVKVEIVCFSVCEMKTYFRRVRVNLIEINSKKTLIEIRYQNERKIYAIIPSLGESFECRLWSDLKFSVLERLTIILNDWSRLFP